MLFRSCEVAWDLGNHTPQRLAASRADLVYEFAARAGGERRSQRQQLVEHQTQRVDLAARIVAAIDLLWGEVLQGP